MTKIYLFIALFPGFATAAVATHSYPPGAESATVSKEMVSIAPTVLATGSTTLLYTQQQQQVQGVITSETGEPMPGVNVLEKGTTNGTSTDASGKYVITVSGPDAVLHFSFIGFGPK